MKLFRILVIASFLTLAIAGCASETQEKNIYEKTMDKSKDANSAENERVKELDSQLESIDNLTK